MRNRIFLIVIFMFALTGIGTAQEWQWQPEVKLAPGETRTLTGTVHKGYRHAYAISVSGNGKLRVTIQNGGGTFAFGMTQNFAEEGDVLSLDAIANPKLKLSESDPQFLTVPLIRIYQLKAGGDYSLNIEPSASSATYKILLTFGTPAKVSTAPPAAAAPAANGKRSALTDYLFDTCSPDKPLKFKSSGFANLKSKHYEGSTAITGKTDGVAYMEINDALLGDITGDNIDEGLAQITCNWGGTGNFGYLVAFNLDAAQPVKIAELDGQTLGDGYRIEKAVIQNHKVIVTGVYQPGKAHPPGERKTQTYTVKNGKFIPDTVKSEYRTIEKSGFSLSIPADWRQTDENSSAIAFATPGNMTRVGNNADITFGIIAGVTAIKPNTAKTILNGFFKEPIVDSKSLDDAAKWFVKENAQLNKYKQIGMLQKTSLDGKSARQGQIEGISKTSGKAETIFVTVALTGEGKLFYLLETYPSNSDSGDRKALERIRGSVRLLIK